MMVEAKRWERRALIIYEVKCTLACGDSQVKVV